MFHSTFGLKIDTSFGGVFELNCVESWNRTTSVRGRCDLTELGRKFG